MSLILINSIYKSADTPLKDILMLLIWSELCRALIYTTNGPNPFPPPPWKLLVTIINASVITLLPHSSIKIFLLIY